MQNEGGIAARADALLGKGLSWLLATASILFALLGVCIGAGALFSGHYTAGAICLALAVGGAVLAHHILTRRKRLSDYDWNA